MSRKKAVKSGSIFAWNAMLRKTSRAYWAAGGGAFGALDGVAASAATSISVCTAPPSSRSGSVGSPWNVSAASLR